MQTLNFGRVDGLTAAEQTQLQDLAAATTTTRAATPPKTSIMRGTSPCGM